MNYLWGGMILVGVVYAAMTGNLGAVTDQALASAKEAVSLCLTMTGAMAFWVGLMKIAEKGDGKPCGICNGTDTTFLFPSVPENSTAGRYMATNMVSNFLGLGWAATPAGISAMKELKRLQKMSNQATDAMCDFLIINISSLQLIPVNIIAYRSQYGAVSPAAIVGPAIIATSISTLAAVIFIKLRQAFGRVKNEFDSVLIRGSHSDSGIAHCGKWPDAPAACI